MGIRTKILLAFILCFGLMAGISLTLLQRSMSEGYDAIEQRDVVANMDRVLQSFDAGLLSLRSQTRDWSEWTDMYEFARDPVARAGWARINIGPDSLDPMEATLIAVFNAHGKLLNVQMRDPATGKPALAALQSPAYQEVLNRVTLGTRCGLVRVTQSVMMTCFGRISPSEGGGKFVGTVVVGRLVDQIHAEKMRFQTGLKFQIKEQLEMPEGLVPWTDMLSKSLVGDNQFWTWNEPNMYHLYYPLRDVLEQNAGGLILDLPRDVQIQGRALYAQIRQQLMITALVSAIVLAIALHFMLIRRLRRFMTQLITLAEEATWSARMDSSSSDELGLVAGKINSLLELIESQVASLKRLTLTDGLTGLINRRAFDARLALEYARRHRNDRPLALLVIDVDYFKRYNDRYGHPMGDAALQTVAEVMRQACGRMPDLAARLGGEEFGILLPETDATGALRIAEQVRQLLTERNIPHADSIAAPYLTVSIGIAVAGEETPEAFMERADQALYHAKNEGRNRVYFDAQTTLV